MPETVTSFHTFNPGTKAKSGELNTNFSNHRGTLLPIDPTLAAAADSSYNLGSSEYWWAAAYIESLILRGFTSTSNLQFFNDGTTQGGFNIFLSGSLHSHLSTTAHTWHLGGAPVISYINTTKQEWLFGGSTVATIDTTGLTRRSLAPLTATNSSAQIGQILISGGTTAAMLLNTTASSTVGAYRITHQAGMLESRLVGGHLKFYSNLTGTTGQMRGSIEILAGATTTAMSTVGSFAFDSIHPALITGSTFTAFRIPIDCYTIQTIATGRETVFNWMIRADNTSTPGTVMEVSGVFMAKII